MVSAVYAQRNNTRGYGLALRCVSAKANQLANFPLNFLRTGDYDYSDGKVYYRTTSGYWWSATRNSAADAISLRTSTTRIYPQSSPNRGDGLAVGVATKANQLANFPLNFLRTGHYNYSDGKLYYRTTTGLWWSATRNSATNANDLATYTSYVRPQDSNSRGNGFAVRCGNATQRRANP